MSKTIIITDRQFDWLTARARGGRAIPSVLDRIIDTIERYEKDLAKFQAWVDASKTQKEAKHDTLPLE